MEGSTQPQTETRQTRPSGLDMALRGFFLLSIAVACLIAGAYLVAFDTTVYRQVLKSSFDGLRAVQEKRDRDWRLDGWFEARNDIVGRGIYQPELAYNGMTVYTSMGSFPSAQLVNMEGEVVHQWRLRSGEESSGGELHWRRIHLCPNGDLIAIYNAVGQTPYGWAMVKIDKDSKLLWQFEDRVHHDFSIDEEGRIYALTHYIRKERVPGAGHLKVPLIEDFIVVLSPEGKELRRISIFDAFAKSKYS